MTVIGSTLAKFYSFTLIGSGGDGGRAIGANMLAMIYKLYYVCVR